MKILFNALLLYVILKSKILLLYAIFELTKYNIKNMKIKMHLKNNLFLLNLIKLFIISLHLSVINIIQHIQFFPKYIN